MRRQALFSPDRDRAYRYALSRWWDGERGAVLFVGLNPSTADAERDDQTVRRCVGFARAWGYGGVLVGNLYAYRATRPAELTRAPVDPVGPNTDFWLAEMAKRSERVVVAWGAHPMAAARVRDVTRLILAAGRDPYCLGRCAGGEPRHPARLRADTRLEVWG